MLIQFLVSLAGLLIIFFIVLRLKQGKLSKGKVVLGILFWLLAIILVWYPGLTMELARILGVGRGTDAVFYVSLIIIFYLLFRIMAKIDKQDQEITKIARQMAINKAEKNNRE